MQYSAKSYIVTHEYQIVSLSKSHDENCVNDSKSHEVLSKHSVDHDNHRTDKLEAPAEEEKVETIAHHNELGQGILNIIETKEPGRNTKL